MIKLVLKNLYLKQLGLFLCCCWISLCQGQEHTQYKDSLQKEVYKLEKLPATARDGKVYIELLLKISERYIYTNQDSLRHYAQKSYRASKALPYAEGMAKSANHIGWYYNIEGDTEKAITYINRAITITDSIGQTRELPEFYKNLGAAYSDLWNYEKALYYYLKGLDYAEKLVDLKRTSEITENIALLFAEQERYEEAYGFYEKLLSINAKLNNKHSTTQTLVNLAKLENLLGKSVKAEEHINEAIVFFKNTGAVSWLGYALEVKAEIYIEQQKFTEALVNLEKCITLYTKIDDRFLNSIYKNKAKAQLGLNNFKEAQKAAEICLSYCQKYPNTYIERDLFRLLYQIHKAQGQMAKALAYHESCSQLSDSLQKDKNNITLTLYKTKMSFEKEKEMLIAQNKEALAEQRYIMWASIIVLTVLLAMAIPLFLNHKKLRVLLKTLKITGKELKEREVQLRGTNKTKDRLFSIIGHDLRGPIGALQTLLGLMADGEIEKKGFDQLLPKVKTDVDHILFTLNNLLSWGNSQSKGGRSLPKMVLLRKIATQNIQLLSEMAAHKSISITNDIPRDALVLVDENQIDVVLRNLISNAIKFTPNMGRIIIKAEDFEDYWQTSVQDNGVGMDEQTQRKIFEDHTTLTNYGTNNEKGTGLGLSLCKEMVQVNQGKIWVESKYQHGSTFYFTTPKAIQNHLKTA